jgi:hypothetical protein
MKFNFALTTLISFAVLFFINLGQSYAQESESDDSVKILVEEWQTNPEAFAKLFFGDDLSRELATTKEPGVVHHRDEVTESVVGAQVEWSGIVDKASLQAWAQIYGSPLEIRVLFGPEKKQFIHITGSNSSLGVEIDWKDMVKNIKPGTNVRVKMKIAGEPIAAVSEDRFCFIMVRGNELELHPINDEE